MKLNLLFSFLLAGIVFQNAAAQDLINRVPKDAQVVITLNNKAVFDHIQMSDLNETLKRLDFFDKLKSNEGSKIEKLEDLGINLDEKAYLYVRGTDSIQFFGGLIPLKNRDQFESIIPKNKKIELVNSLPTIYSADRKIRLSWDNQTVYIMNGSPLSYYFDSEENKERFGLKSYDYGYDVTTEVYPPYADSTYAVVDAAAVEAAAEAVASVEEVEITKEAVSSVEEEVNEMATAVVEAAENDTIDDYAVVDSVLAQEEYADDYSSGYDSVYMYNDSVKTELTKIWINEEMSRIINDKSSGNSRKSAVLDNKTLAHIDAKDLFHLYGYMYDKDILENLFGGRPKFDYGINGAEGKIVVDQNKMKFIGEMSLDKEMAQYYKAIYNKKINPKFLPFLEKDILGFASFNMNTEAYIKNMPKILEKYYGSFMPKYSEAISLSATIFDIVLDEVAISKVFKGDNLFVLNGVTQQEVSYTDYEYDSDYNYKEVEKTKTETIPQFMWMFSSDDMRIFEKLTQVGLKEDVIIDNEGIYNVIDKSTSGIKIYYLMKNGVVYVGNDMEKLRSIQANKFAGRGHAPYINMVKKNRMALLFNTKQVPTIIDDLDIPIERSLEETVSDLSEYGDFYMISSGMKANKFYGEVGLEFPKKDNNALNFLFKVFDRWTIKAND